METLNHRREKSQANERMDVLLSIANSIHTSFDVTLVFSRFVESLAPIISFDWAGILAASADDRTLKFREVEPAGRGLFSRDSSIPLEGSAAEEAIRSRLPVYLPDLEAAPRFAEDLRLRQDGIRCRLSVPLFLGKEPVGSLEFACRQPDQFPADDIDFLGRVAGLVSVALANSEAHRQVQALRNRVESENARLRDALGRGPAPDAVIGDGAAWKHVLRQIELVAPTDATVLIRGETGTGKELAARAIHRASSRKDGPFVAVNCAALSPELVASELFGHERGAFSGAHQRRAGRFELADGGTLFLDEVGDLPADVQVQLLRVLQERAFERVGGTQTLRADARVIAATNRDLDRARVEGRFRDDLFFRLNVFPLTLPPLRERKEDIEPLLRHFLRRASARVNKRFAHVDRQSVARCQEYGWPGNVRELENLVERAAILCPEPVFTMNPIGQADAAAPGSDATPLRALVRAQIVRAMKTCRGKIYGPGGAAAQLGLKPSTLQARLKKLRLERKAFLGG